MSDAKWWLVCYDVHDPARLRKCAKHMEGYGYRVQYSVFRCWMTTREMERLRWELTERLDKDDDVIMIPMCSQCLSKIVGIHGEARPADWNTTPDRHQIL